MPFGLVNASTVLQRTMDIALAGYIASGFYSVYINDIAAFSKILDEHLKKKNHLLREKLHSKSSLRGGPVLVHSGPTTGKRMATANREPVKEEASRACTMRTIL